MSKKDINIILIALVVAAAIFFVGKQNPFVKSVEVKVISAPIQPGTQPVEQRQIYDIDKIRAQKEALPKGKVTDLASLYANYPKERTGENIIEAWTRISPEDKAKFTKGLTEEIEKSKEKIKINPDDSRARAKLLISENLRKLALNNFNYKFKDNNSGGK